jgi:DNA topoisomerase-1
MTKKKLVIVESPSKAATIKKYLGSGYSVVASMGHIIDLPKSQLGIDVEAGFVPRYITIRGKGDLVKSLKREAKNASKVFLATDPDREGEAISWHLANLLDIDKSAKCRVTFNEITKKAVTAGIKEPREIDESLVDAQQARRVLDRIVGYKISPILWRKVRKGLSAGRVQSVATKLICDREKEINDFDSKEYWTIDAYLYAGKKKFVSSFYGKGGKKTDIPDSESADRILKAIDGGEYTVTSIKKAEKKKTSAPPFITSTLQQEAGRKLSFTSQRTMQAAQQLYEGINIKGKGQIGLITYMRTDSLRVSDEALSEARSFIEANYGKEYLPAKAKVYKTKKNAQDAHEAIRPTTPSLTPDSIKDSLTNDQYKIYKIIWDRFMASQMTDAIFDTVSADIDVNGYTFRAAGSSVKFAGFSLLYMESGDTDEKKETKLPELNKGDVLKCDKVESEQHFTQPPARYTEASLIKTLEEKGIGRPSTYSPIITTIIARGYVVRSKKSLMPTELGSIVNSIMCENFEDIVDVAFTATMEERLDKVEEGKLDWHNLISDFYNPFEKTLSLAEEKIGNVEIKDEVSDIVCDKCGRMMVYKQGKFGRFLACPGFPECRNTKAIVKGTGISCPKCGKEVIEKKSRRGKLFYGCTGYPECDFTSWDKPTEEKCPKCGGIMYEKAGRAKKKYCPECDTKK